MRTKLVLAASALAASALAYSHWHHATADQRDLLIDRNWIDRMPETQRDKLHVYRFVPTMGGGVFQDRTLFKGTFELFRFKVESGDHIAFDLPETRERVTSDYKIERVDQPPFDLKLTISPDPRGPGVYYGWRDESDRDGHLLEQELSATAAAPAR